MCGQQVLSELIKEHLVALLIAAVVLRVLLLDAVIGQVTGHVLQIRAVVGLRRRPQHSLTVQVDIILMVYKHPTPTDKTARENIHGLYKYFDLIRMGHCNSMLFCNHIKNILLNGLYVSSYLISNLRCPGSNSSGFSRYF